MPNKKTSKAGKKSKAKQVKNTFTTTTAAFLEEIENLIQVKKCSAALAVFTVFREKMDYFMGLENEYFRERALDIQDLKHKLLHAIFGLGTEYQISIPSIILAR